MMSTKRNSIRTILDRMLSIRLTGVLMTLLLSFILMMWPTLLTAQSPSNNNETKITASDGQGSDHFGFSVAISGDTMVVGARYDDDQGGDAGAAYIFERDESGNWNQVAKVTAFDGAHGDQFGASVAISGDTVVIGAFSDDRGTINLGSAYIFERDENHHWNLVKKLTDPNAGVNDNFGRSVAISGETVVIGAPGDDNRAHNAGSIHIFERDLGGPNDWGRVKMLTASDGEAYDYLGSSDSVSISHDTIVIGQSGRIFNGIYYGGSVYIFSRNYGGTNNWGEVQQIMRSDETSNHWFGDSVAIYDNTLVIGVSGDDDNGNYSGSAYIFERDESNVNNWVQIKKLTASDGAVNDFFGGSVAIINDIVVIGARGDEDYSGSTYIFARHQGSANNWGEVQKLTASDRAANDRFGISVATNNDHLVVGAYGNENNGVRSGSAYIYNMPPQLSLPSHITQLISNAESISITVPISLTSNAHDIASLGFSLDYDQSCLSFDKTDSNADGTPDTITDLQAGFQVNVEQDLNDADGELDLAIYSSPVIFFTDGLALNLTFEVDSSCVPNTSAGLSFSTDPSVTFGNTEGESVVGSVGTDGPLAINIAPRDMSLSSQSVDEEEAISTTVGTLSTVDLNSTDTHSYSLVSGVGATNNISFTLEVSGVLKTKHIFDFEQQDSFSIRVRSDDGRGGIFEKPFTITINDTPDAPTGLNLSNQTILEGEPISTTVGILTTIDPESGDTHTYSLVEGAADNAFFDIVNDRLKSKAIFDYDNKNSYSIRLRTTDSANKSFEREFTITVIGYSELSLTHSGHYSPTVSLTSQAVTTTLQFESKGNSVSKVDLSLDYDQNCLQFSTISHLTATVDDQESSGQLSISLDGGANALTDGPITTVQFVAKDDCASGTPTQVLFSSNPTVTLTDTVGVAVPNLTAVNDSILILSNDSRGDCNMDNRVDAGDFPAIVLEMFDSDDWLNAHQSSFSGSAIGCDANSDELMAVSDVICTVLVFFGDESCTNAQLQRSTAKKAGLSIAAIDATAGESVEVPIKMSSNGNQIAAAAFSLQFDQEIFFFDPTDHDGDGIPDAITFSLPNGALNSASFDAQNNRLNLVVGHIALPQKALSDGTIATVTLQVKKSVSNASMRLTNKSLSDTKGRNVPLTASDSRIDLSTREINE